MFEQMNEAEAKKQILDLVSEYCDKYHNQKKPFSEGDRIPYASRVYDHGILADGGPLYGTV